MKLKATVWGLMAAVGTSMPAYAQPVCVDFEPPLPLGATYGAPAGNTIGDIVFTTNQIPVAVDFFFWPAAGGTFEYAEIDNAPVPIGAGQSIRTNNINLLFDFSAVGFTPSTTTFTFLDLGGNENFSVNGCPTFNGDLAKLPPLMCGTRLSVSSSGVPGGIEGKVEAQGPVFTLKVGGQEFWLDDVCVQK